MSLHPSACSSAVGKENTSASTSSRDHVSTLSGRKDRLGMAGVGGSLTTSLPIDKTVKPGEFVLRALFAEFAVQVDKKIDLVLSPEAAEKPLSKLLQRGEDPLFDQLLSAFGSVAEHCLPSLLRTLFAWYERQLHATQELLESKNVKPQPSSDSQSKATGKQVVQETLEKNELLHLVEKRDLCVEFVFCLMLIEVLRQLPLHPGHEDLITYIEDAAFRHFRYIDRSPLEPNVTNFNIVADLYAEVIGVLVQSRFQLVRKRFTAELSELRAKEISAHNTNCIISLLMGMKFFRIKMVPIEEFEASFQFMKECALYFLEVKDKDIKHALAGLFVEILVPVAATVKNEVNVPCLKSFVETLFPPTLDLCTKKKHQLAIFPLVTCLLCVSQKSFFLQNWHYFLAICLSNLKNRDQKMSRVALESLYRLLWVYMIRIKCESNTATQSRLHSIVNSLFPKGSKAVVPRDTPLNIFVKIIQFIAQERLDFAMKEIVFDLLSVGRPIKIILTPERMSIGLRAFLVVADSLQQKEGEPPMPRTSVLPSGNVQRVKKTFLNKTLTEEMAKAIGVHPYYPFVRKALNDMLRALDIQLGKPLLRTALTNQNKEFDELVTGERKPKIDLFRTCVAAIPRLLPDGLSRTDLIDLLCRLTVHVDDEMNVLAFQALQNLINDFEEWRPDVIDGFVAFIMHEVSDTHTQMLEHSLRMLLQLLSSWKSAATSKSAFEATNANKIKESKSGLPSSTTPNSLGNFVETGDEDHAQSAQTAQSEQPAHNSPLVLHKVEALCLAMLCSGRQPTRRLAVHIIKEVKSITNICCSPYRQPPLLEVLDRACPAAFTVCSAQLSIAERQTLQGMCIGTPLDLQWLSERSGPSWTSEGVDELGCASPTLDSCASLKDSVDSGRLSELSDVDMGKEGPTRLNAWSICLMELLNEARLQCPTSTLFSLAFASQRMQHLYQLLEAHTSGDNRASALLRGASSAPRKTPTERPLQICWWQAYLMFVCRIAPGQDPPPMLPHESQTAKCTVMQCSTSSNTVTGTSTPGGNTISSTPISLGIGLLSTSAVSTSVSIAGPSSLVSTTTNPISLASSASTSTATLSLSSSGLGQSCSSLGSSFIGPSLGSLSGSLLGVSAPVHPVRAYRVPSSVQLVRSTLALLRNEQPYIRSAAVLGLSCSHAGLLPTLLHEMTPLVRECIDRKQENMRRRKRREQLRAHLGKLLHLLAERHTLVACTAVLDADCAGLCNTLVEYLDGIRGYLEHEASAKELDLQVQRTQFFSFVSRLISGFSVDARAQLISADLRRSLFHLFAAHAGSYTSGLFRSCGLSYAGDCCIGSAECAKCTPSLDANALSPSELIALQAMSSVLCCGRVYSEQCLAEGSVIFRWLLALLSSNDQRLHKLGQETVILLLEFNPEVGILLDWLVDCCYTKNTQVADICFRALATIFAIREYPCDQYIAIVNLALLYVSSSDTQLHRMAVRLLQLLHHRFFDCMLSAQLRLGRAASADIITKEEPGESAQLENLYGQKGPLEVLEEPSCWPENKGEFIESNPQSICSDTEDADRTLVDADLVQLRHASRVQNSPFGCMNNDPQNNGEPRFACSPGDNQQTLSARLAQLHPQITMAMFSEITYRFQTAKEWVAQRLLKYLIPWLYNMELVDAHFAEEAQSHPMSFSNRTGIRKEGWGSKEATEMVLNNLFYITVRFSNRHPQELDQLWVALSSNWPNNVRVVIRYLFIITALEPHTLLPHSKRVCMFLARARPARLVDELMMELQTVETLNCIIERTKTPPFYRIMNARKTQNEREEEEEEEEEEEKTLESRPSSLNESSLECMRQQEVGILHTKRHSTESSERLCNETNERFARRRPETWHASLGSKRLTGNKSSPNTAQRRSRRCSSPPQPLPLPMPEYGGYYAPLGEHLGEAGQPVMIFHRCNLAMMFLCDLLLDDLKLDWSPHLPLLLHISMLGMDHSRPLVHLHCRQLLINVLCTLAPRRQLLSVARITLHNYAAMLAYGLSVPSAEDLPTGVDFTLSPDEAHGNLSSLSSRKSSIGRNRSFALAEMLAPEAGSWRVSDSVEQQPLSASHSEHSSEPTRDREDSIANNATSIRAAQETSGDQLLLGLLHFLTSREEKMTLWNCEDITAKVWSIPSAQQLTYFLRNLLRVLADRIPAARVAERWAEVSLQLALSCSSRHLASRSLQIFRAIQQPINCRILADILSRLVETVAEQGDDMQGYVTELMLTLESSVEHLDTSTRALSESVREMFKSTPNLNPKMELSVRREALRNRSHTDVDFIVNNSLVTSSSLHRSHSSNSLQKQQGCETKTNEPIPPVASSAYLSAEDRIQLQAQLVLVAVALLETDYEHEFLLAIRLMEKLLKHAPMHAKDFEIRLSKLLVQCRWNNFAGLHTLLLKGLTGQATFEATVSLLHRITPLLHTQLVDPSEMGVAFPFHVMALLPYMLQHYDEPNALCVRAAQQIAARCSEHNGKLDNLATVMSLYSRRAFSKESFQWTKCVVKYLHDAQPQSFLPIVTFLVDVLEKGPTNLSPHIIAILNCILHYVELGCAPPITINSDLQKVVGKYVEGAQWKGSLKILKLVVTRSSTLAAAPSPAFGAPSVTSSLSASCPLAAVLASTHGVGSLGTSTTSSLCASLNYGSLPSDGTTIIAPTASFCDSELASKRELPGRTIDFTFDLAQTPIVGRKYIAQAQPATTGQETNAESESASPRRSLSYTCSFNETNSNWRRPWLCQSRVRERLVSVLSSCGQRVGLPKSPSVIFSQNSDVVERQSSLASSTEEISTAPPDSRPEDALQAAGSAEQFGLFKEFDFLEYELGSQEEESMDNFNWGVRRRSLSSLTGSRQEAPPPPRTGSPASAPAVSLRKDLGEFSSDEEGGCVSPVFNYNNELNLQELSPYLQNTVSSSPSSVSSISSTCSLTILNQIK